MIKILKFVQGATKKRGDSPELQHFRIERGHVQGFNGALALSAPINFDIDCLPKADQFIKAISSCKDTVELSMTPNGRLSVRSGKYKAFIECLDIETALPRIEPEGENFTLDGEKFLDGIKTIFPFIDNKNNNRWSNGVLFNGESLFATNNIVVVEYWLGGEHFKPVNIPYNAIKEMIRVNEVPTLTRLSESNVTFSYEDGKWIKAQLLNSEWPDIIKVLSKQSQQIEPIDERLFEGIEAIKSFADSSSRIYFHDNAISTSIKDGDGATFEIDGWKHTGVYQATTLLLLKDKINKVDFSMYPEPALFYGDNFRGVVVGMRE